MQPVFRTTSAGDLPALVALVNDAYRGNRSRAGWTTEADLLHGQRTDVALLTADLTQPGVEMVLAEAHGVLVGCFMLAPADDHGHPGAGYLGMLTVDPARQAEGLGRALIVEAERRARERGWTALVMTVIAQRVELIAYYGRRGFVPTGERERFPYGDERFGVPQRDDLEFVLLRKPLI